MSTVATLKTCNKLRQIGEAANKNLQTNNQIDEEGPKSRRSVTPHQRASTEEPLQIAADLTCIDERPTEALQTPAQALQTDIEDRNQAQRKKYQNKTTWKRAPRSGVVVGEIIRARTLQTEIEDQNRAQGKKYQDKTTWKRAPRSGVEEGEIIIARTLRPGSKKNTWKRAPRSGVEEGEIIRPRTLRPGSRKSVCTRARASRLGTKQPATIYKKESVRSTERRTETSRVGRKGPRARAGKHPHTTEVSTVICEEHKEERRVEPNRAGREGPRVRAEKQKSGRGPRSVKGIHKPCIQPHKLADQHRRGRKQQGAGIGAWNGSKQEHQGEDSKTESKREKTPRPPERKVESIKTGAPKSGGGKLRT